jgi:hypothetical protein
LTRLLILLGSFNKYVTLAIAPRSRDWDVGFN